MKKEFMFRGKTLEELQRLSIAELAKLLPARQRRTMKRGFSDGKKTLVKKLEKHASVETHERDMIVLPFMVGKTIKIHTGKEFVPVIIQPEMIGCYLGELALTRKRVQHNAPGVGASKTSAGQKKA
ncbi:MAG: 30S ribosomal protein S19 [archaeon]